MSGRRFLGVDHGSKRTGLALSDPSGTIANPLEVVEGGEAAAIERIAAVVAERDVAEVVVGLPKNMDGSVGPQAAAALAFTARLTERLAVPVSTWDERLTSIQADQALAGPVARGKKARGPSREDVRERRDKVAASLLLQSWLDARARRRPS